MSFHQPKCLASILRPCSRIGYLPTFQVDDIQKNWNFRDQFDVMHIRHLQGSIEDWPKLYSKMFTFLNPGGWFQHTELGVQMHSDCPKINRCVREKFFSIWPLYTIGQQY